MACNDARGCANLPPDLLEGSGADMASDAGWIDTTGSENYD
jgi:hypothetical protein